MEKVDDTFSRNYVNRSSTKLFFASFAALFFELLVIRYLSTEIRVFAYLKNLPLLACFLGIGVGMIYGRRNKVERLFPWAALALFAIRSEEHTSELQSLRHL